MVKSPCKGCTERCIEPNCHMFCEEYLKFQQEHEEEKRKDYLYRHSHYVAVN